LVSNFLLQQAPEVRKSEKFYGLNGINTIKIIAGKAQQSLTFGASPELAGGWLCFEVAAP